MKAMRLLLISFLLSLTFSSFSEERDFTTPERVLKKLFPDAQIVIKNLAITKEQKREIEKLARTPLDSRLISVYIVKRGVEVVAYAYVDVHRVRTHSESVLFVISPEGKIELVEVLSFNEPLEYMADKSWLALFKGKSLEGNQLKLNRDIPNMTGATLTARAIVKASRRTLAIWKILFGKEK